MAQSPKGGRSAKRKRSASSSRSPARRPGKKRSQRLRLAPYLAAAAFCVLCLCITLADYVNPFSIFPTWDEIFTTIENLGGGSPEGSGNPAGGDVHSVVKVHMIDIGQGDSILIEAPEANVLIDAGENGKGDEVLDYLKAHGVSTLDIVIGTHAHSDHIGGMDDVIKGINVKKVILPEMSENTIPTTKTYTSLLTAVMNKGLKITTAKVGDTYNLGDGAALQIVGPNGVFEDLNNTSVVCRLTYGENAFLFTGDCEVQAEAAILQRKGITVAADVLKVGHHGSDTSTSDEFLEAVAPEIALISVGTGNTYGHPVPSILEKLENRGIEIYRTDLAGSVVVTSDGKKLTVTTEK